MKRASTILNRLVQSMLDFCYPPFCLHCESRLDKNRHLFCAGCNHFFELIDPSSRCLYCFAENEGREICRACLGKKRWHVTMGAALDYMGAVSTLVKRMKQGAMPYLAKTAASFMMAQLFRLGWPLPDLILPVPRRHWFQGKNHAELLAKELARQLHLPCLLLLCRETGDLSQARLNKQQREKLSLHSFYLRKSHLVENKVILLVDDEITTGSTIRNCAEALAQSMPKKIYALSLARSIQ